MAYVYRHIRLDKNEPFYIGVGLTDDAKFRRAYTGHGRNSHWKNVVAKTEYEVDILFSEISNDFAFLKEKEFIALYKRRHNGGTLTNLTDGGDGMAGHIMTAETRAKIGAASKGKIVSKETIAKMLRAREWYVMSDETRKKISIGNKGKKLSLETIEKYKARKGVLHHNFGKKASDYVKQRISESNKGVNRHPPGYGPSQEARDKALIANLGKKHSIETKNKMSDAHRGRKFTDETKAKISASLTNHPKFCKEYTFINPNKEKIVFLGLRKFCKENGLSENMMYGVAKGKYSNHRGWKLP